MSTASSPRRNPLNGIAPRFLSVVAVYALVLVVLFTVVDNMIASLYPSIETVEEHSSELQQDEFSRVAAALSPQARSSSSTARGTGCTRQARKSPRR